VRSYECRVQRVRVLHDYPSAREPAAPDGAGRSRGRRAEPDRSRAPRRDRPAVAPNPAPRRTLPPVAPSQLCRGTPRL